MGRHNQNICAFIQILEPKSSEFLDNGILKLDADSDFQVRTTRKLEELIEFDKISIDQPLDFSIPRSRKNDSELGWYVDPSLNNPAFKPIKCQVVIGGYTLQHSLIHVVSCSEKEQRYEVELRNDESHWIFGAKNLKLRSIKNWPLFVINKQNIVDSWGTPRYIDGDIGVQFPLVYHGAWYQTGNVKIIDFRPWVNRLALLQRAFSDIGWQFKCPYLETNWGRELIDYLIDPLQNQDEKEVKKSSCYVTYEEDKVGDFSGAVVLDKKVYDAANSYNSGRYVNEGIFDIASDLIVDYDGRSDQRNPYTGKFTINLIKNTNGIDVLIGTKTLDVSNPASKGSSLSIDIKGLPLSITDFLYISVDIKNNPSVIWNVNFKVSPANSVQFKDGWSFRYPSVINKELTLYDYLKGTVHEISGIFDTDLGARTVTLYTPFKANVFGQSIEGYFKEDEVEDLVPNQEYESCITYSQESKQRRFLRLQYKEASDARIRGLNFPKDNPPFSRTYDINKNLSPETEVSANPFYEPTINDDVLTLFNFASPIEPGLLKTYKIGLPFLVDNDSGNFSFNVGYRTLHFEGLVALQTPEGVSISAWKFENEILNTFPYAFQYTRYKKGDGSPFTKFQMYGDDARDLFNLFHRRYILENQSNFKCEILHYSKSSEHFSRSFRKYYKFMYKGQVIQGRLVASRDHDGCANTSTPLTLIPKNNRDDIFVLEEREADGDCSLQKATLNVNKSGDTYTATADTSGITKTILSTVIRWKYVNAETWTVGNVVTNPTDKFIFMLQIEVEDCNDIIETILIDPCNNNKPLIQWEYRRDEANDLNCIKANIVGELNNTINYGLSDFQINLYQGATLTNQPYTVIAEEGEELCLDETYTKACVSFLIKFNGIPCDPVLLETCFDLVNITKSCKDNKPTVLGEHVGNGDYRLVLGGSWVSKFQSFELQFKLTNEPDTAWRNWDGHEPLFYNTFVARVVMWFCDQCPPVCSDPVSFTDPLTAPFIAMTEKLNFVFDWDSLPDFEKDKAKKYLYENRGYELMSLANEYKIAYYLSENGQKNFYKFCCGEDLENAKKWFKKYIVQ